MRGGEYNCFICIAYKASAWDAFSDYDDYESEEAEGLAEMYAELLGGTSPDSTNSVPTPRAVLKELGVMGGEDGLEKVNET